MVQEVCKRRSEEVRKCEDERMGLGCQGPDLFGRNSNASSRCRQFLFGIQGCGKTHRRTVSFSRHQKVPDQHHFFFKIARFTTQHSIAILQLGFDNMGAQKKTRKFATVKRIIGQRDSRLKKNQETGQDEASQKKKKDDGVIREVQVHSKSTPLLRRS